MNRLEFNDYGIHVSVKNKKKDIILGHIVFYKPWKKYVFESNVGMIYSAGCMQEIVDYMKGLKK